MVPIKTIDDATSRLSRYKSMHHKRNQMADLCDELYYMDRERKSGFMPDDITAWRANVSGEYWESTNKGHNAVDLMTAVLGGNTPMFHVTIPGTASSSLPSRAELFLQGVWRLNSRRQQTDLFRDVVTKTVQHGACGIRTYWMPNPPKVEVITVDNPDEPQGQPWVVQLHDHNSLPIVIEVVDIRSLYPGGKAQHGRPFSEIFHVQTRTLADVVDEWEGAEGVDLKEVKGTVKEMDWDKQEAEYIEWWGRDRDGVIWYAIIYDNRFIIKPTETEYPDLPYTITSYIHTGSKDPSRARLPMLFSIFHQVEKLEYIRSRSARLIDMYANMVPYHSGENPIQQIRANWGELAELGPKEDIKFPQWPGQPPDMYREEEKRTEEISQGTVSDAMYGQVSGRASGYALSQVVGSDMLRGDTPRANLELAYSSVADQIFGLLRAFSPRVYLSVLARIRGRKVAALLSGDETGYLEVDTFVKPKATSDEVRLAALGAQLASLPNSPVSMYYILERYFGVDQPEVELARKYDEDALKDPMVKMMAMIEVLQDNGSPYAGIMMAQLQQAMGQAAQPPAQPPQPGGAVGGPEGIQGIGLGLPQATMGNEPQIPPSGNPSQEQGFTRGNMMTGGPTEGLI